ncbi:MAG: HEPN domain-containing protein [Calditrichaeota bacterium]|nr:HEPN domain-containing protein [Calditrichota bacterium]
MDEQIITNVQEWLDCVEEDRRTTKSLLKYEPTAMRNICFHAQQMAEKALKAFLCANERHIEKVHDLTRLITLCAEVDPEFTSLRVITDELTPYAVVTRYPSDYRSISLDEAKQAVVKTERIYDFVKTKLDPSILI